MLYATIPTNIVSFLLIICSKFGFFSRYS
uniref:Uncharacterized protein n=1 Tax=Rhizophora mucronata TaxID=61149 RepID=A0A2P2R4H9_RHIMU